MEEIQRKSNRDTSILWELIRFAVIGVYGTLIDMAVEGWVTSMFAGLNTNVSNHVLVFLIQFVISLIGFLVATPATWSLTAIWGFRNVRKEDEVKAKSLKGSLQFALWSFFGLLLGAVIQFIGYMTCIEWSGLGLDILNGFEFSKIFSGAGSPIFWAWIIVFVIRTCFTMVFNYLTRKFILYRAPKAEAQEESK